MSIEKYHEDSIKPLINEWISLRETNLSESELKRKLDETYKTVIDFVFFVENCGFVKQFVELVNHLIQETECLKRALKEEIFENDIKQLIMSSHVRYNALFTFKKHYSEDMKSFKSLLKQRKNNLLSILEELRKKYLSLNISIVRVINQINSKNTQKNNKNITPIIASTVVGAAVVSYGAPFVVPTMSSIAGTVATAASCVFVPTMSCLALFDVTCVSLTACVAFHYLKSACHEHEVAFTQEDLNMIGLRASTKTLQKLIIAINEKTIYEEDFGKHSRIYRKTVRLIETELNKLSDLMLYKVKNEMELHDMNGKMANY